MMEMSIRISEETINLIAKKIKELTHSEPQPTPPTHQNKNKSIVDCDLNCCAMEYPETFEEYVASYYHWKEHLMGGGCSHGR